jgi:hypothetical protein
LLLSFSFHLHPKILLPHILFHSCQAWLSFI